MQKYSDVKNGNTLDQIIYVGKCQRRHSKRRSGCYPGYEFHLGDVDLPIDQSIIDIWVQRTFDGEDNDENGMGEGATPRNE